MDRGMSLLSPRRIKDKPWCPVLILIPAGRFLMGSPENEARRFDREGPLFDSRVIQEGPQHEVTIAQSFWLGKYPITFNDFDDFCDATDREKPDDIGWGRGYRPVFQVSHDDATAYCAWLSRETGQHYFLPSEAQWEYACRAGTSTPYAFGDNLADGQASSNGSGRKNDVGSYPANAWGLHDMHGRIAEWCADHWHSSYEGAPDDGSAWLDPSSHLRVVRGGSWNSQSWSLRSAARGRCSPDCRDLGLGFRCARLEPP